MATIEELEARIAAMAAQIAGQGGYRTDQTGRSPVTGPYTNLLDPKPSAFVPKANFFFEGMDLPKQPYVDRPFPCIRYRVTDHGVEERTFKNLKELVDAGDDWQIGEPVLTPPTSTEALTEALTALTPEEQTAVLAEQQDQRKAGIVEKMAAMPIDQLDKLLNSLPMPEGQEPPKRRGRPKKVTTE